MSENESRPVVVGVDGSAAAQEALRWAIEDARRRGSRVDAVSAWHPDYGIVIGPVPAEVGMRISPEAMRAAQQTVLDTAVQEIEGAEGVEIRRVLVEGDPRTVLTEASKNAELLVVGSRGHGPLAEAVLGSVSSYCVHHASCPVVVLRAPKAEKERSVAEAAAPVTPGPLL
ncbi:universal stress protein [Lentzea nigeriaca]|uniref:universal stress protein n=1 Tax=Lentzea nigeriaca TaxID=1128665 RepID=UPI00195E94F7|nr:universal stress protein [Lentzea nigeriaca]MBM7863851.1 nucleotide-binding universal stress UspA family protein [Lentzea nigeriaca]